MPYVGTSVSSSRIILSAAVELLDEKSAQFLSTSTSMVPNNPLDFQRNLLRASPHPVDSSALRSRPPRATSEEPVGARTVLGPEETASPERDLVNSRGEAKPTHSGPRRRVPPGASSLAFLGMHLQRAPSGYHAAHSHAKRSATAKVWAQRGRRRAGNRGIANSATSKRSLGVGRGRGPGSGDPQREASRACASSHGPGCALEAEPSRAVPSWAGGGSLLTQPLGGALLPVPPPPPPPLSPALGAPSLGHVWSQERVVNAEDEPHPEQKQHPEFSTEPNSPSLAFAFWVRSGCLERNEKLSFESQRIRSFSRPTPPVPVLLQSSQRRREAAWVMAPGAEPGRAQTHSPLHSSQRPAWPRVSAA